MSLTNYRKIVSETPDWVGYYVDHKSALTSLIQDAIESKYNGDSKGLAKDMGISHSELHKLREDTGKLTIKDIAKLEAAIGKPILNIK